MATIEEIRKRIQASCRIEVAGYFRLKASFRSVDEEQAVRNLLERQDGVWRFSQHKGVKGRRIEVFFKVSSRTVHKYVLEANEVVYLINVIVIDGKKQKRLREHG